MEAFVLYKGFVFLKGQVEEFVRTLVDLEHHVALAQTQLNNFGKDFRGTISKEIINIGKQTGTSFVELAKAEFNILGANIELSKSFRVLELSAKAAKAGGIDQIDVAFNSALTQANAFGISILEMDRIFDLQFNTIKRGIFTYEQFASVVGEVSIAFAGMGQEIELANAAIAAVSQVFTGPQLAEGAVGLKNAALQIRENVDRFEDFGIAVTDASGNFLDFITILRNVDAVLSDLTEEQRARALQELFQEKRAVRGVSVLLNQLGTLEEFYVEQKLAVGDLDKANETMNDTLIAQARIFKNELIPAADPFLNVMRDILKVFSSMNDLLPGLTQAMLAFGIAAATVGGASLIGGMFGVGLSRRTVAFSQRIQASRSQQFLQGAGLQERILAERAGVRTEPTGRLRPTMLGGAAAGVVAFGAFEAGRQARPGQEFAGGLGAIGTGALTGAVVGGGVPGALVGGALGGAVFLLGNKMKEEAPNVAKSFTDAFSDNLKENSGDVAAAFIGAMVSGGGEGAPLFGPGVFTSGTTTRTLSREETLKGMAGGGTQAGRFFTGIGLGVTETVGGGIEAFGGEAGTIRATEGAVLGSVHEGAREARKSIEDLDKVIKDTGADLTAAETNELRTQAIRAALDKEGLINKEGLNEQEVIDLETKQRLATILAESNLEASKFTDALGILQEAQFKSEEEKREATVRFLAFIRQEVEKQVPQFDKLRFEFQSMVTGDFAFAAEVFKELGESGRNLSEVFTEIAEAVSGFETLGRLAELKGPGGADVLSMIGVNKEVVAQALIDDLTKNLQGITNSADIQDALIKFLLGDIEKPVEKGLPGASNLSDTLTKASDAIEAGLINPIGTTGDSLRLMAQTIGEFNVKIRQIQILEEVKRLAEMGGLPTQALAQVLEHKIREISIGGQGFADILASPDTISKMLAELDIFGVEAAPEQPAALIAPGATSLADSMFEAADRIRAGLIDPMDFTADQLEMFGEELQLFNKQIFKIGILEELGRLGEFAGFGKDAMRPAIEQLIKDITIGGMNFADMFADPTKLADLLAEIEFGDINVDQSVNNNFTIRISEGVSGDPENLARIADGIMREINDKTRKRMA